MNKKGESNLNIIALFVAIVIAIPLFLTVQNNITENVTPMGIVNQTLNITNESTTTGTNTSLFTRDELTSGSLLCINATSNTGVNLANFTIDYEAGTIYAIAANSITKSTAYSNRTLVNCTYTYETDNYVEDSTSRTLINQIPLLFAISVLLLVVGYVWFKYIKDIGDI